MYIEGIELLSHADRIIDLRETKSKNERLMKKMEPKDNMLAQKEADIAHLKALLKNK